MIWFLLSSSLLMAVALLVPSGAVGLRRRALELAVVAILLLPWLSLMMPAKVIAEPSALTTASASISDNAWLWIWLAGIAMGTIRGCLQWRQVRRLRVDSTAVDAAGRARITHLLQLADDEALARFRVSSLIETPLVLPGPSGCVLLPRNWMTWPLRLQKAALRHEWHHVQRHDALLGCLMRCFAVLLWFHPLVWWLVTAWVSACEHEADHAAVEDIHPADYAEDLLAFATGKITPTLAGLPAFTRSRLSDRIALLLVRPERLRSCRWAALGCLLALAGAMISCAWLGRPVNVATAIHEEATLRLSASAFPADEN